MTKRSAWVGAISGILLLTGCNPPQSVVVIDRGGPSPPAGQAIPPARPQGPSATSVVIPPPSTGRPDFVLYNDIRDPVVDFQTLPPGRSWSSNWLGARPIPPGSSRSLNFGPNASLDCRRQYMVRTESGKEWKATHDFCNFKGIHVSARGLLGSRN